MVCGYVYEGENPPAECPQCHVPGSKFAEIKSEGLAWACEHKLGDGRLFPWAETGEGCQDGSD